MVFDGYEIELPKLTLGLSAKMDEVQAAAAGREQYKQAFALLKAIVPADVLAEILDGEKLEEIDLQKLLVLYQAVVAEYRSPIVAAQLEALNGQLEQLAPITDTLSNLSNAAAMLQKAQPKQAKNRQNVVPFSAM